VAANNSADTRDDIDETFGGELGDDLLGSVGVDLRAAGESSYRRECLTGQQLSAENGFFRGEDNLIGNRSARLCDEAEGKHTCNMTVVTPGVKS
jgi:hypothetical protein